MGAYSLDVVLFKIAVEEGDRDFEAAEEGGKAHFRKGFMDVGL